MSLFKVFDVSGSGMSAQSVRLNLVASNLANTDSVASTPEQAYRARHAVFQAMLEDAAGKQPNETAGVRVAEILESDQPARTIYEPQNPLADENGYVYAPNINGIEEMANMISASRSYQTNVEVMNTAKQLLTRTLQLGR